MRLLYLSADPEVPVLGHTGGSVALRELARELAAAGVEVHIASPRVEPGGNVLASAMTLHPIPPVVPADHDTRTVRGAVTAQTIAVVALAARLKVDAIYERSARFTLAGVRSAAILGITHVLEVTAPPLEVTAAHGVLPHPALARALEAEVLAETDRVLAASAWLAGELARGGVDPAKLEVVAQGVAAQRFPSHPHDPKRFVVGFAGSLAPWHGVETLVEAIARVGEVHLEVIGQGPSEWLLDQLPARRVTRLGAHPQACVAAIMAGWDVGVAPHAPTEGAWFSPVRVLEYMAAGACPIVSNLGDASRTLGGGERGVLVPAGDVGALANAIRGLAGDRAQARRLGARGRAWVRVNRSWSATASRAMAALGSERAPDREGDLAASP